MEMFSSLAEAVRQYVPPNKVESSSSGLEMGQKDPGGWRVITASQAQKGRSRTYGESWGGDCGKSLTQI